MRICQSEARSCDRMNHNDSCGCVCAWLLSCVCMCMCVDVCWWARDRPPYAYEWQLERTKTKLRINISMLQMIWTRVYHLFVFVINSSEQMCRLFHTNAVNSMPIANTINIGIYRTTSNAHTAPSILTPFYPVCLTCLQCVKCLPCTTWHLHGWLCWARGWANRRRAIEYYIYSISWIKYGKCRFW